MATSYHHGDLRRALLDATIEMIEERGGNGVNMAEAARRVGVSSGAPYKHFKDKDALLCALVEYIQKLVLSEIADGTASAESPAEAFRLSGIIYTRWAARHPELFMISMDPRYLRLDGGGEDDQFWREVSSKVRSGGILSPKDPLMEQLSGRVMIIGLATLFANGIMAKLGVDSAHAERLARVLTGEKVSAINRKK